MTRPRTRPPDKGHKSHQQTLPDEEQNKWTNNSLYQVRIDVSRHTCNHNSHLQNASKKKKEEKKEKEKKKSKKMKMMRNKEKRKKKKNKD